MTVLLNAPADLPSYYLRHGFYDDFHGTPATAPPVDKYSVVTAVDGTVLTIDGVGGQIEVINAVASIADNEDCYLAAESESFLLAADKPLWFGAATKFTQVSTNTVNSIVGITDGVAADLLIGASTAAGTGPKASGETICFYTHDGSLSLYVFVRNTTTVLDVELTAANSLDKTAHLGASTAFQELSFEFMPKSATQADVTFMVNRVPVYRFTDFLYTATTPTELQPVIGVKGGTAAAAKITADYLYCWQKR